MTCILHQFPIPDAYAARLEAQAEAVRLSRRILRYSTFHSDDVMHEACVALLAWGDGGDQIMAEEEMFRLQRRRVAPARSYGPQKAFIRSGLVDALGFIGFAAAVLIIIPLF